MTSSAVPPPDVAISYHLRTKHSLTRYAAGPEALDWDMQPNPFRDYAGAPRIVLPLGARALATVPFGRLRVPGGVAPRAMTLDSVALLLELSFGLSAWKELGPDRWALRCNPSSGNLHPTEAYVLNRNIPGIEDGLHHYLSRDHVLETRRVLAAAEPAAPGGRLWIGLGSVHWREAWKYGERAFRYCQLDVGHALGALRMAAAVLGWRARVVEGLDAPALAALLGLDRAQDFAGIEAEEADILVAVESCPETDNRDQAELRPPPDAWPGARTVWMGRPNRLDPHPLYHWPIIDTVAEATRGMAGAEATRGMAGAEAEAAPAGDNPAYPPREEEAEDPAAATVILGRRSAQRFDARFRMNRAPFLRVLEALLPRASAPWDLWRYRSRLHPLIFVHRVEGLDPGLYALPRHPEGERRLRAALRPDCLWEPLSGGPAHLPLFKLLNADCRAVARTASCHQAIASDGCASFALLGEFEPVVRADPWRYRQLHWEAGLVGQALYLEAEAVGLRGTGIGCFFDDDVHGLFGLEGLGLQSLYHFTLGRPLVDSRLVTLPAYPDRPTPAHP